jgi:hypothetical protein
VAERGDHLLVGRAVAAGEGAGLQAVVELLSITTTSPGLSVGTSICSTQAEKVRPLIGPSST